MSTNNKELEYLDDRIKTLEFHIAHPNEYNLTPTIKVRINDGACYKKELKTLIAIKQALTELKQIKEAEPSEALRYIQQYLNEMTYCLKHPKEYVKNYDKEIFYKYQYTFESVIESTLLKAQEQDKVLKIIFEKNVDIEALKYRLRVKDDDVYLHYKYDLIMPREEFDLLKRWCEKCIDKINF